MTVVNIKEDETPAEEKKEKKRKPIHPGLLLVGLGMLQCLRCGDRLCKPHDDIVGRCKCGIWVAYRDEIRWIRYSSAPVRIAGPGESFELTAP